MKNKGFTFIEMIVAIIIIAILAVSFVVKFSFNDVNRGRMALESLEEGFNRGELASAVDPIYGHSFVELCWRDDMDGYRYHTGAGTDLHKLGGRSLGLQIKTSKGTYNVNDGAIYYFSPDHYSTSTAYGGYYMQRKGEFFRDEVVQIKCRGYSKSLYINLSNGETEIK